MRRNHSKAVRIPFPAVLLLLLLASSAFAQDGHLYLMGGSLNGVWRFDGGSGAALPAQGQSGAVFVANGAGGLVNPKDLAFGMGRDLLAIGTGLNAVLRYNRTTGAFVNEFVPNNTAGIANLEALVKGPDGHIYLVGGALNGVWRFHGGTGAPLPASGQSGAVFVANNSGGLANPKDLAFGPDGNLYVIGEGLNAVLKYSGATGAFVNEFVPNNSAGIANLEALTFGPDGHLYVVGGALNGVWRFNGGTGAPLPANGDGAVFVTNGSGGLGNPKDLAFGPDGHLYVIGQSLNAVLKYNGVTGVGMGAFVPNNTPDVANLEALIFPAPYETAPAAGTWALGALTALLCALAAIRLARRGPRTTAA